MRSPICCIMQKPVFETDSKKFEASVRVCRQIIRTYAKSFWLASLALPAEKRKAAEAIYAFCRFSDNIVDNQPANLARIEWAQWHNKLCKAFEKNDSTHPVLFAFVRTCRTYAIPEQLAFELLDGLKQDLDISEYQTFDELYQYCYKVAGIPGLMLLHVLGFSHKNAKKHAVELGIAMQLTNILRDVHEDLKQKKIFLPKKDLERFGCTIAEIRSNPANPGFLELLRFETKRARAYYQKSLNGIPLLAFDSRFCVLLAYLLYSHILVEIENRPARTFGQRAVVPVWKKMFLLFSGKLWHLAEFSKQETA